MTQENDPKYWHLHRHELRQGMIFKTNEDEIVRLSQKVSSDETEWYVEDWSNGWFYEGNTIEPSDLRGQPLPEPTQNKEDPCYWYHHRSELNGGMVFKTEDGETVRLNYRVPGDGTRWYVESWHDGWTGYGSTIEPGDLRGRPLPEPVLSDDDPDYWYHYRSKLRGGMIFKTENGNTVRLDRSVPGDGTQWYVDRWFNDWFSENATIEPGDLRGQPLPEPVRTDGAVENPAAGARARPR